MKLYRQLRGYTKNTRLRKTLVWVYSKEAMSMSIGLLTSLFVARTLTQQEYGLYRWLTTAGGILGLFFLSQAASIATRECSKDRYFCINILSQVRAYYSLIGLIFFYVTAYSAERHGLITPEQASSIYLVSVPLAFNELFSLYNSKLVANSQFALITKYEIVYVVSTSLTTIFVCYLSASAALILSASNIIGGVIRWALWRKHISAPTANTPKDYKAEMSKQAIQLSMTEVPARLFNFFEATFVTATIGLEGYAAYAIIRLIPERIYTLLQKKTIFALPYFSKTQGDARTAALFAIILLSTAAASLVCLTIYLAADFIISLFGVQYAEHGSRLALVSLYILTIGKTFIGTYLVSSHKIFSAQAISYITIAAHFISLLILAPTYGLDGVVYAFLFRHLFSYVLACYFAKVRLS